MAHQIMRYDDRRFTVSDRCLDRRILTSPRRKLRRQYHDDDPYVEGYIEETFRYFAIFAFSTALITLNPLHTQITRETASVDVCCHKEWYDN